ncbi:FecR family protein [Sphingosinicella microcystinivorans]|uniref:FecR family protein n=1 Tax=Sphingosinicella microcystinivorans TaxID=335406 RepID=UPI0022F3F06F|nr:FecR domain-containing protein [Sphingosinicella microcystinivorans]WBX83751.1 FecR domain-containing protein [Sphingosinicella microcystinivorans]
MTDPSRGTGDALRREAARWFARMRGPEAERWRAEFEAWFAAPEHRAAYNRASEVFGLGKLLRDEGGFVELPRRAFARNVVAGAAAVGLLGAGGWLALAGRGRQDGIVATHRGEIRAVALADGSTATLDTETRLALQIGAERRVTLMHGRARFVVAPDARRFVVRAGSSTIVAHGTVFDVTREAGGTAVALLEGRVEVADAGALHPLAPGEAIRKARGSLVRERTASRDAEWPAGIAVFEAARLAEVIGAANRYGPETLVLAGSDLADLKVSGRFRVNDPHLLAPRLARMFGLRVEANRGVIRLARA